MPVVVTPALVTEAAKRLIERHTTEGGALIVVRPPEADSSRGKFVAVNIRPMMYEDRLVIGQKPIGKMMWALRKDKLITHRAFALWSLQDQDGSIAGDAKPRTYYGVAAILPDTVAERLIRRYPDVCFVCPLGAGVAVWDGG